MKPTLTRTLCLSAFALLLLQGALLNCVACGHSVEAVAAHLDCDDCHDHEGSSHVPCHRCEIHPSVEVLHPSRTDVHAFTFDIVPAPHQVETFAQQPGILLLTPNYTAPPDPGWRNVGTTIIRC